VGVGTFIGAAVALWYATFAPSVSAKHPTKKAEYLRLPMACVGGPPFVISLLWLGWSSSPNVHWSVPLLSMLPYGGAYLLVFVAMINVSRPTTPKTLQPLDMILTAYL